jgi:hypothetical protein
MKIQYILSVVVSFFLISVSSYAESGKFDFHTGWSIHGADVMNISENHMIGSAKALGVTFNNKGEGFLHNGEGACMITFEVKDGKGENKGYCTWSDADGDHIFTSFVGDTTKGTNTITGGTGKYTGITGSGPWACKDFPSGANSCKQSLSYKLP